MQSPYRFERERAPAIENLVHPIAAADEGNEVTRLKPLLIHMILDRLHPGLEDRTDNAAAPRLRPIHKHVEAITLGRVTPRGHQALDLLESVAVIMPGLDWRDVHDSTFKWFGRRSFVLPVRTDETGHRRPDRDN